MKILYSFLIVCFFSLSLQSQNFVPTFESYKNVVLEELTGIHCTYCPDGHLRANNIKAARPDRVVLVNIHAGGYANPSPGEPDFRTTAGNYIDNLFNPSGYPAGAVNREDHNNDNRIATGRGDWYGMAQAILPQISPVNVAAQASLDMATSELIVDVEAYYTSDGIGSTDKIHVFILQNNVAGPQVGAAANPTQIDDNGNYIHNHMLRHSLTGNSGMLISNNSQGDLFQNQFTYTIPSSYNGVDVVLNDLEIVVFVTDVNTDTYTGAYADLEFITTENGLNTDLVAVSYESVAGTCDDNFSPLLNIFNKSSVDIQNLKVEYSVNGAVNGSYTLTNLLSPIPTGAAAFYVPSVPLSDGVNNIVFEITEVNGSPNTSSLNTQSYTIETPQSMALGSGTGVVEVIQDRYGSEITWDITNTNTNSIVLDGGPYSNLSATGTLPHNDNFTLTSDNTCYTFIINDSYGDGICCSYGNGSYTVELNGVVVASGGSYEAVDGTSFKVGSPANVNVPQEGLVEVEVSDASFSIMEPVGVQNIEPNFSSFALYPNPASENISIDFTTKASKTEFYYTIQDLSGKTLMSDAPQTLGQGNHKTVINTSSLANGNYLMFVYENGLPFAYKFSVQQ